MDSLMALYDYIIWFAVFSFAGWLFECVNNIVVKGQWENRGFLWGPLCPIYGVGVVSAMALFRHSLVGHLSYLHVRQRYSGIRNIGTYGKSVPCSLVGLQQLSPEP